MTIPKYTRIERERRFLVIDAPPSLCIGTHNHICDRYITGTRLRLRTVTVGNGGEQIFKLCKKYGAIADAAEPIVNIYLTAAEHSLLSGLSGAIIEKRRYHSDVDGVRYTVDVFENALTGLILAEVEADDAATLAALAMPPWANREVTRDPWFRGGHLATVTSEMLRDHLQRIAES